MKFRHNKKRNTAFIYEVLIKELSKASMKNLQERKRRVVHILKSFFSKDMPLKKELDIYHSFNELSGEDKNFVQKIIFEARTQADRLNSKEIYELIVKPLSETYLLILFLFGKKPPGKIYF